MINNNSKLPTFYLDIVIFSIDNIGIIERLGPNKAHGQHKNSFHMLKTCGNSIGKPLQIVNKERVSFGGFFWSIKRETLFQFIKGMTNST